MRREKKGKNEFVRCLQASVLPLRWWLVRFHSRLPLWCPQQCLLSRLWAHFSERYVRHNYLKKKHSTNEFQLESKYYVEYYEFIVTSMNLYWNKDMWTCGLENNKRICWRLDEWTMKSTIDKSLSKLPEKRTFCRCRVADDAHVDVSAEVNPFARLLVHTAEQEQQNPTLYVLVSCVCKWVVLFVTCAALHLWMGCCWIKKKKEFIP